MCPSAHTFPFGQRGLLTQPQISQLRMLEADDICICWLLIGRQVGRNKWGIDSRVHRNGKTTKKHQRPKKARKAQSVASVATFFVTLFHFSSLYVITLSAASWRTDNSKSLVFCTMLEQLYHKLFTLPPCDNSSLQVDRTSPNCQTVNPRSLLNHPNSLALTLLSLTLNSRSFICAIIQWAKSLVSQDSQLRLWAQEPQWPSYQPSVCVGQLIRRKLA